MARLLQQGALVGALGLLGGACDDSTLDTVRVCGDLVVPDELVALRVTVWSVGDGVLTERTGGAVVLSEEGAKTRQLPVEVAVRAVSGERVFRAQALGADGTEVGRGEVLVSGSPSEAVVVNVTRACLGFVCPLGQTCEDAACVITPAAGTRACLAPEAP
jgi:hypothetical protein